MGGSNSGDDAPGPSDGDPETRGQVVQRHKREMKAMKAQVGGWQRVREPGGETTGPPPFSEPPPILCLDACLS